MAGIRSTSLSHVTKRNLKLNYKFTLNLPIDYAVVGSCGLSVVYLTNF